MSSKEKKGIEKCIELLKQDGINSKSFVLGILEEMLKQQTNKWG